MICDTNAGMTLHLIPIALGLLTVVLAATYVAVIEPAFAQIPARVYQINLTRTSVSLGNSVSINATIANIGIAEIPMITKGRLQTMPPIHSYLAITADDGVTYAPVFWSTGSDGLQHVTFNRLTVPVQDPSNLAAFVYSSEMDLPVNLGTH